MQERVAFGPFVVDVRAGVLRDREREVRLRPKTWRVLVHLAENGGRLVTKQDLLEAVWPDTVVTEEMVAKCVRELRRALGEKGRSARYLEVVHGRGFRLKVSAADRTRRSVSARVHAPGRLEAIAGTSPLVSRANELAQVAEALERARSGRIGMLAVSGEAGIGKTRLLAEAMALGARQGFAPLVGRCMVGEANPPFWPWVQIVRDALADDVLDSARFHPAAWADDLGELLPELRSDDATARPIIDSDQARFRLFDALVGFLRNAAAITPLLIALDDLHGADTASLALLEAVHREAPHAPILVLASLRPATETPNPRLHDLLAVLEREGICTSLRLDGLDAVGVGKLLESRTGSPIAADLAASIALRTGGNPYFCLELWTHMVERSSVALADAEWRGIGDTDGVPEGVAALIEKRLASLAEPTVRLLSSAAVCGLEFDFDLAAEVAAIDSTAAFDGLEEALRIGWIVDPRDESGRYRFIHGLAAEALYRRMSAARRRHMHWQVAQLLTPGGDAESDVDALAFHGVRGADNRTWRAAVAHAERAATHAAERYAYETAAAYLEDALDLAEKFAAAGEPDRSRQLELALSAGTAHTQAGNGSAARTRFRQASQIARELGATDAIAQAALGMATRWPFGDGEVVTLLEEALASVTDPDGELGIRLRARLAQALYFVDDTRDRREALCREALTRAQGRASPGLICTVLNDSLEALFHCDNVDEQRTLADRLFRTAHETPDQRALLQSHAWRTVLFMSAGELHDAEAEIATFRQVAEEVRQPEFLSIAHSFVASLAIARGRFTEAESHIHRATRLGERIHGYNAWLVRFVQLFTIRREQGRSHELAGDDVRFPESGDPAGDAFLRAAHWTLPFALVEQGDLAAARDAFDQRLGEFGELPPENSRNARLSALAALGHVAARLDDANAAAKLRPLIEPYADRWMVVGFGNVVLASMRSVLAAVAATLRDYDTATGCFERSIADHDRQQAVVAQARTLANYAAMLLDRAQGSDHERAAACIERGLQLADAHGLGSSGARLAELRRRVASGRSTNSATRRPVS